MQVLIVGFGSIGQRHMEILQRLSYVDNIDVVSQHANESALKTIFSSLDDVVDINKYDYFIVSNQTALHLHTLEWLNSRVSNKKILVEKPLTDGQLCDLTLVNDVYVAYNLRYHPIMCYLQDLLRIEKVLFASIHAGQFLPEWRPNRDYRQTYSADINQGGGVLRDLSHELDYAGWLFGSFDCHININRKISDLEINSDDIFMVIANTSKDIVVNITLDYISKNPLRRILIHTNKKTVEADFILNQVTISELGNQEVTVFEAIDRNYTYTKMHDDILQGSAEIACSYAEGCDVVRMFESSNFAQKECR